MNMTEMMSCAKRHDAYLCYVNIKTWGELKGRITGEDRYTFDINVYIMRLCQHDFGIYCAKVRGGNERREVSGETVQTRK